MVTKRTVVIVRHWKWLCRQAEGLVPLIQLLRGGPRNQAAACAAGALAALVANNGINQDAAADAGGIEEVVELLSAAVAVATNDRCMHSAVSTCTPARQCPTFHYPALWWLLVQRRVQFSDKHRLSSSSGRDYQITSA